MRLFALLLLMPAVVAAQGTGTLTGRVVDDTGLGLPGASVVLEGTMLGAATGPDGRYHVLGVPAGTYTVVPSFTGFSAVPTLNVYVGSGETVVLEMAVSDTGFCCFGACLEVGWEPSLALMNPDPYASRRLRPDDLALLAYR
ncbi:MAG TPA: carboxypeptidase-like regulatory domain-containing protein [Rhodothermales bacterium]|nr:carboxypeptidase-like regulatory domain-containing protein [Rhodothermales bacterium]